MSSPFFITAPLLRAQAYSVLPLMPNSKRPAIEKWSDFCVQPADDETFKRWMRWKNNGIGVCLGVASNLVAIDFDYDCDGLHDKIKSMLPESPVAKMGEKGETRFYQYNGQQSKGYSVKGQRVIDILSVGRQTVLPPTMHPDIQKPYKWLTDKTLINMPASELPHIEQMTVYDIGSLFKTEPIVQHHFSDQRHTMVYSDTKMEEVAEAISYIPADDYDIWYRIGMCLKHKFGDSAFSIWDHWSQGSSKYKNHEMRPKWNSFTGQGLTIASLFYFAMDYGYTGTGTSAEDLLETEDFVLNGKKTGDTTIIPKISLPSKPEFIELPPAVIADESIKKTTRMDFPPILLKNAPGLPGMISDLMNKTSLKPQPILALAASICMAGTLMGRKVQSETNLRTNFYIMGLAPSGAGKDHARKIIKRMMYDSGQGNLELPVPASSAGLVNNLRDRGMGRGIVLWDEFGRMLKQITGFKAGNHERDIVTAMIELFSSSDSVYIGKGYANHDGKNPVRPIDQPCLSIYGTSVPGHFYEALSGSDAIDGFLSRWMIFESRDYTMREVEPEIKMNIIPQAMIDVCKFWKSQSFNADKNQGNVADATIVSPRIIRANEAAEKYLKDFVETANKMAFQQESSGDHASAVWARAGEHARRLALVCHEGDEVTLKVAEYAVSLAKYCCEYMANAISDYVSSSELESQTKRILRCIKDKAAQNDGWLSRADLTRNFQGVQARTRNEILASLIERGEIIEEKIQSQGGRPKLRYKAS